MTAFRLRDWRKDVRKCAGRRAQVRALGRRDPRRCAARSRRGACGTGNSERHVPLPGDQARFEQPRALPTLLEDAADPPAGSAPNASCSGSASSAERSGISASSSPAMRSAMCSSARWCSRTKRRALQYGQDQQRDVAGSPRADRPEPLAAGDAAAAFQIPARCHGAGARASGSPSLGARFVEQPELLRGEPKVH